MVEIIMVNNNDPTIEYSLGANCGDLTLNLKSPMASCNLQVHVTHVGNVLHYGKKEKKKNPFQCIPLILPWKWGALVMLVFRQPVMGLPLTYL